MASRACLAFFSLLFAISLSGQALTDHAAAVAGASAGVAGARALRDPLTNLLQSAADVGSPAPQASRPAGKPQSSAPAVTTPKQAPAAAASTASPSRHSSGKRGYESRSFVAGGASPLSVFESPAPAPPVTTAQLLTITSGAARSDVIGSLGAPSGRITMDDNGHLVEILQYSAQGSRVGSVRVSDGKVESVNTVDR